MNFLLIVVIDFRFELVDDYLKLVEIFSASELQSLLPRARRTGVTEIDLSIAPGAEKSSVGGKGWLLLRKP
jgi:hypothetical protein